MNSSRKKHEEILKLISLFRDQPCLWDSNCEESKSAHARKLALEEIADRLNASCGDVRRKLHNLRSQYRRENIRIRRLKTNKPKWIFYNSLKFLGPSFKTRRTISDPLDSFSDAKNIRPEELDLNYEEHIDTQTDDENSQYEQNNYKELPSHLSQTEIKHQNRPEPETETLTGDRCNVPSSRTDVSSRVIILPNQTQHVDEYEVFGENVANELRSLENNKNLQYLLKCNILQAILDVNKSVYDSTTTQDSYEIEESPLDEFLLLPKE